MIEINPIIWKVSHYDDTLSCFIHGCHAPARYVVKIRDGDVIIQVCLCDECLRKSPKIILQGLGGGSQNVLN